MPPPPELGLCTEHLRCGRVAEAVTLSFGVMRRHALDGAALLATVLQSGEPTNSLEALPSDLARDLLRFVCDELRATCARSGAAAAAGTDARKVTSVLEAADAAVGVPRLLTWVGAAVQQRWRGGDDHLTGPLGTQLARVLRKLSASPDPALGIESARLSALLSVTRRQEVGAGLVTYAQRATPLKASPASSARSGGLARLARELTSPYGAGSTVGSRRADNGSGPRSARETPPSSCESFARYDGFEARPRPKVRPALFSAWLD